MLEQTKQPIHPYSDLNPYISALAERIMAVACAAELKLDSPGWQLVSEVLSYAASAEQRLSEQQIRIDQLEQMSLTDDLTGILNRQGMKRQLALVLSNSARHQETGVFGFMDLNNFKEINDIYGHDTGDAALRHFARSLKNHIRPSDIIARLSGDEFVVILPRCKTEFGRKRLRDLQVKINHSQFVRNKKKIHLTCALGISEIRPGINPDTLIASADLAMYQDKATYKAPNQISRSDIQYKYKDLSQI